MEGLKRSDHLKVVGPKTAYRRKPGPGRGWKVEEHDRYGEAMRYIRAGAPRSQFLDSLRWQVNRTSHPLSMRQLKAVLQIIDGG